MYVKLFVRVGCIGAVSTEKVYIKCYVYFCRNRRVSLNTIFMILFMECLINIYSVGSKRKTSLHKTYQDILQDYAISFSVKDLAMLNTARNNIVHNAKFNATNKFISILCGWSFEGYDSVIQYTLGEHYNPKIVEEFWAQIKSFKDLDFNNLIEENPSIVKLVAF